jgi:hypothetical protein
MNSFAFNSNLLVAFPILILLGLMAWAIKRNDALKVSKQDFFKAIADKFGGQNLLSHARFTFDGIDFEAFISDPILLGADEFRQVVPGFFSLKCKLLSNPTISSPVIIQAGSEIQYPEIRAQVTKLFETGFKEVEISATEIQARKLNLILSRTIQREIISDLTSALPALKEIRQTLQ